LRPPTKERTLALSCLKYGAKNSREGMTMHERAKLPLCVGLVGAAVVVGVAAISSGQVRADDPNSAPNPYRVVEHWAKLPEGRVWGQPLAVEIDRDGTSL
jgi:hypothetical protein